MRESPGQQFYHYTLWEDWHAGMYKTRTDPNYTQLAAQLLRDPSQFLTTLDKMTAAWPIATAHNLTNLHANHRPWLGRAATCYQHGATIPETNLAWATLHPTTQAAANQTADLTATRWRTINTKGQLAWT